MKMKTNSLKPDKDQPRKTFPEKKLERMYRSIKRHGILEPIIIDQNNMIIDGECRWRCAKKQRLKEVPVRKINISANLDRRAKQLVANYHRIEQEPMEQAKLLQRMSKRIIGTDKSITKPLTKCMKELSDMTGISQTTIHDRLTLLEAPEPIQKKIESGKVKSSYVVEAMKTPEPFKKEMLKKISHEKFKNPLDVREQVKKLKDEVKMDALIKIKDKNKEYEQKTPQNFCNELCSKMVDLEFWLNRKSIKYLTNAQKAELRRVMKSFIIHYLEPYYEELKKIGRNWE